MLRSCVCKFPLSCTVNGVACGRHTYAYTYGESHSPGTGPHTRGIISSMAEQDGSSKHNCRAKMQLRMAIFSLDPSIYVKYRKTSGIERTNSIGGVKCVFQKCENVSNCARTHTCVIARN